MPDDESAATDESPDIPPEPDDAWVPLPSTRRLRGGRRGDEAPRPGDDG